MLLYPEGRKWKWKPTSKECSSRLAISSLISSCGMDELVKIQATPVDFTCSFWVFLVSKITGSVVLNSKKTEVNVIPDEIHEYVKYDSH